MLELIRKTVNLNNLLRRYQSITDDNLLSELEDELCKIKADLIRASWRFPKVSELSLGILTLSKLENNLRELQAGFRFDLFEEQRAILASLRKIYDVIARYIYTYSFSSYPMSAVLEDMLAGLNLIEMGKIELTELESVLSGTYPFDLALERWKLEFGECYSKILNVVPSETVEAISEMLDELFISITQQNIAELDLAKIRELRELSGSIFIRLQNVLVGYSMYYNYLLKGIDARHDITRTYPLLELADLVENYMRGDSVDASYSQRVETLKSYLNNVFIPALDIIEYWLKRQAEKVFCYNNYKEKILADVDTRLKYLRDKIITGFTDLNYLSELSKIARELFDAIELAYKELWKTNLFPDALPENLRGEEEYELSDQVYILFLNSDVRELFSLIYGVYTEVVEDEVLVEELDRIISYLSDFTSYAYKVGLNQAEIWFQLEANIIKLRNSLERLSVALQGERDKDILVDCWQDMSSALIQIMILYDNLSIPELRPVSEPERDKVPCPMCGKPVDISQMVCPYCRHELSGLRQRFMQRFLTTAQRKSEPITKFVLELQGLVKAIEAGEDVDLYLKLFYGELKEMSKTLDSLRMRIQADKLPEQLRPILKPIDELIAKLKDLESMLNRYLSSRDENILGRISYVLLEIDESFSKVASILNELKVRIGETRYASS